jgi:hypothetical protein
MKAREYTVLMGTVFEDAEHPGCTRTTFPDPDRKTFKVVASSLPQLTAKIVELANDNYADVLVSVSADCSSGRNPPGFASALWMVRRISVGTPRPMNDADWEDYQARARLGPVFSKSLGQKEEATG